MRSSTPLSRIAPPHLVARARAGKTGICIVCFATARSEPTWVLGTGERLCTEHTPVELRQGHAALLLADQEAGRGR